MSWQEPLVGVIVGFAIVSLYRHLRGLLGSAVSDTGASCHGCDDCDTETAAIQPDQSTTNPPPPQLPRVP